MTQKNKLKVSHQPDGNGYQITHETKNSRRVYRFPKVDPGAEPEPHAAGSYHDPEHHHELMKRVEAYTLNQA